MFRHALSFTLSLLLMCTFATQLAFAQARTTSSEKQAEFKKRVVEWGTNRQVNVKLNSGEKISGRIAEIQDAFFALQSVTKDGRVTSQPVNFSDIHKLSVKRQPGSILGHTALGVLAGVGAVFVTLFVIYAASDS
jgi:uncharacterized protein (DUF58 family)